VILLTASVNASKQLTVQHKLAIEILQKFGHNYCRLVPRGKDRFHALAWSVPLVDGNGSARISKRGKVQAR
jgi:hypothetical protein